MNDKVKDVLTQLTLEEKAALCSGIGFWETTPIYRLGVDSVKMTDGPHGLRVEVAEASFGNIMQQSAPATCFPPAVTVASTWDRDLAYQMGAALADESKEYGVSTVLGPGVNIKRHPLCGRNFEYFSEDPLLSGEIAAAYINGCQDNGVGTSLKHYAVNSQEWRRMVCSSEVDERAFREIYLPAFETAVKKAQPWTVMCSYNPINGVHASDNKMLLTDILRDEWGFKGIVVSDWGAVNDRVKGIEAGLDLQMPGCEGITDKMIVDAVKSGKLDEKSLDVVALRMLEYAVKCMENKDAEHHADFEKNHKLAKKIAESGCILLKNDDNILPLKEDANILVVGKFAKHPRYQGVGSSQINPHNLVSLCDEFKKRDVMFDYTRGFSISSARRTAALKAEALEKAKDKDYILVCVGLTEADECEAVDRHTMSLSSEQNQLIDALCELGKKVIVVLSGGSSMELPWIDKVAAVLNLNLSGEAGGEAATDILFGIENPCGKLAETYPYKYEDLMARDYFHDGPNGVEYKESIYVGYRYYDKAKKEVLFPFGYGLSYTKFEYSNIKLSTDKTDLSSPLEVSVDIKNIGKLMGKEIVQLYVKDVKSTVFMPEKELKGFEKIELLPDEVKTVTFKLDKRAFSFYNTAVNDWSIEEGDFEILIGASSRDIRESATVYVEAKKVKMPNYKDVCPVYYDLENVTEIDDSQWEALKGRPCLDNTLPAKGCYTYNTLVSDCDGSWFGKLFKKIFTFFAKRSIPNESSPEMKKMVVEGALAFPVRNFYAMSNGIVPLETTEAILDALNGKVFTGLIRALFAFLTKGFSRKKRKAYAKKRQHGSDNSQQ